MDSTVLPRMCFTYPGIEFDSESGKTEEREQKCLPLLSSFLTVVTGPMVIVLTCLTAVFCLELVDAFLRKKRAKVDYSRSKLRGMHQLTKCFPGLVM